MLKVALCLGVKVTFFPLRWSSASHLGTQQSPEPGANMPQNRASPNSLHKTLLPQKLRRYAGGHSNPVPVSGAVTLWEGGEDLSDVSCRWACRATQLQLPSPSTIQASPPAFCFQDTKKNKVPSELEKVSPEDPVGGRHRHRRVEAGPGSRMPCLSSLLVLAPGFSVFSDQQRVSLAFVNSPS